MTPLLPSPPPPPVCLLSSAAIPSCRHRVGRRMAFVYMLNTLRSSLHHHQAAVRATSGGARRIVSYLYNCVLPKTNHPSSQQHPKNKAVQRLHGIPPAGGGRTELL